jgi:4-diphosphocytidyl-2-C-methyl-D-erythritol kinase
VERLAALGLQLGSDVPVFVHGHNAFARGRGEQLQPLDLPASWYLVVHPGVSVATGEIFGAAELTRDTPPLKIPGLPPGGGHNDCEPAVRARYPAVAQALDMLSAHQARLTGTGACVFVATATQQAAQQLAHGLPAAWRSYVVRSLV